MSAFYNPAFFLFECFYYSHNQFHFFFTINEVTLMLYVTMNEIKHCARKSNYAFDNELKRE